MLKNQLNQKKRIYFFFSIFFCWLCIGWLLVSTTEERNREIFASKLGAQNALLALSISNELNRIRVELPKVQDLYLFRQVLTLPNNDLIEQTNIELKERAIAAKASAIFIADLSGKIIAKGNRFPNIPLSSFDSKTAIGINIADKPYFQQASLELNAEYYETNHTLSKKMYHFAFPIKSNQKVIGIITLSYDLRAIYALLDDNSGNLNFLVGLDGVIFASNDSEMDYRTISPFSIKLKDAIQKTKRYGSSSLNPISSSSKTDFFEQQELEINIHKTPLKYLIENKTVNNASWVLFSGLKSSTLLASMLMTAIFYLTVSSLLFLFWLYLRKRSEVQKKLASLNIELEDRVDVSTSGLTKSNIELKSLVSHYQTTQEKLEQTQYELLQSARLAALGELSATLNHELSQPALALRAYTENSLKLLERGDMETVHQNFTEMRSICVSMANIMTTIKNFSRQSSDKMRNVSVDQLIKQSMPIVNHLIEKSGAHFHPPQHNLDIKIRCIPEQIEQVLVNLISNACDAVQKKPNANIWLHVVIENESVNLVVKNDYSSVTKKELTKLFNPYYTTKKEGLGLGLVLCKRIIEAQDGMITAKLLQPDQIEFTITLQPHSETP